MSSKWRGFTVAGVAHQRHPRKFVSQTSIYVNRADGHIQSEIRRCEHVVATIVIAPFHLFEQVESVSAIVVFYHQLCGDIELAEIIRKGVARLVPIVIKHASHIRAGSIFAIESGFERGSEMVFSPIKQLLIIECKRADMFVKIRIFAGDIVAG